MDDDTPAEPAGSLTAGELRAGLRDLGWSARLFAHIAGVNDHAARNWLAGRAPIPAALAAWLVPFLKWRNEKE